MSAAPGAGVLVGPVGLPFVPLPFLVQASETIRARVKRGASRIRIFELWVTFTRSLHREYPMACGLVHRMTLDAGASGGGRIA